MELYTLDGLLRRTELVEGYESFLWTERYSDLGDLQIVTPSTAQYRNLLASGTFMGLSESQRVMKIETLVDAQAADGTKKLTITGKEITDVLNDRVTVTGLIGVAPNTWTQTGKPSDVIRALFDYGCRNGYSAATDALPLITAGSLNAAGNLPEDGVSYTFERKYGVLFDAMKEIGDIFDLGFRLYKGPDTATLYFDVYKGTDRTSGQTAVSAVIFSEDLDSLQNVSELTSVAKSKNVAYVKGRDRTVYVYSGGASSSTAGFGKRMLYVDGTDIQAPDATAMIAALTQRGQQELAKNRSISAFDGEITQLSPYKYNTHYAMGDLVEMRNSLGLTNQMLVTEQIFSADATGERAYPTLTIKRFITPGSWLAWENSQVWVDAPGTWATS